MAFAVEKRVFSQRMFWKVLAHVHVQIPVRLQTQLKEWLTWCHSARIHKTPKKHCGFFGLQTHVNTAWPRIRDRTPRIDRRDRIPPVRPWNEISGRPRGIAKEGAYTVGRFGTARHRK